MLRRDGSPLVVPGRLLFMDESTMVTVESGGPSATWRLFDLEGGLLATAARDTESGLVAIDDDGRLLNVGYDGVITDVGFDHADEPVVATIDIRQDAWSPRGVIDDPSQILAVGEKTLRWYALDGELIREVGVVDTGQLLLLAGRRSACAVVGASDATMVDLQTGEILAQFPAIFVGPISGDGCSAYYRDSGEMELVRHGELVDLGGGELLAWSTDARLIALRDEDDHVVVVDLDHPGAPTVPLALDGRALRFVFVEQ